MSMKTITPALAASLAALTLASCGSKIKEMPANWFSTNPNPLEVIGGKVPAVVTGSIPAKVFVKNAVVTVTPVLSYDGTETAYTSAAFQGEDVRGNNTTISYTRGGLMTVPVDYTYVPEMHSSQLYLDFSVNQSGKIYALPRVKVADGCIATATLATAGNVTPALTPDAFQRIINEKYSADIRFLINQAVLRSTELNSQGIKDLNAIIVEASEDPFRELREINVSSYASPEGSLALNTRLAEAREKATMGYVEGQLKKDKITEFGELTAEFTPEDWEGFAQLVAASDIQDKELIISVLSMYNDPEEREREIRNMSHVFEQLADQILPQLRYSRITASIDVVGKSDNEIIHLVDDNPAELNVEELLYAATLTDDPARKMKIYQLATKQYPNDYRTWNNLGMQQYLAGDYASAATSFNKAAQLNPTSPDVKMNQGLIAMLNGDYSSANAAFGQASGADNLNEALGTYYLSQGDYKAAVRAFGDTKSNNAAVAQILAKDYTTARSTLDSVKTPDATTYYLKAVVAARTGNQAGVLSNLSQVKRLDPVLYQQAQSDLEFASYVK